MKGHEEEVCSILLNFPIVMAHADAIIKMDLIPELSKACEVTELALDALAKVFVVCTIDQLRPYEKLLEGLIDRYREKLAQANILLKLLTVISMNQTAPELTDDSQVPVS